jgi:hypothetical protein
MIEWRRVPWPLWAYSVATLLGVTLIEVQAHGPVAVKVLYPVLILAWLYCLLVGVRWVWIVTLVINVLGLIPYVISGSLSWQGVILSLVSPLLLLLPVTRRYFSSDTAVAA